MQARISIVGGDRAALESLNDWLRREHELAGRVMFAAMRPREGELGALGEALVVAVGAGGNYHAGPAGTQRSAHKFAQIIQKTAIVLIKMHRVRAGGDGRASVRGRDFLGSIR